MLDQNYDLNQSPMPVVKPVVDPIKIKPDATKSPPVVSSDALPIAKTATISKIYNRITDDSKKASFIVEDAKNTLAVVEKLDPKAKEDFNKSLFQDRERMLYLALAFNTMRLDPDDGLTKVIESELKDLRKHGVTNKTYEYLKKTRPDLYNLVKDGSMTIKEAVSVLNLDKFSGNVSLPTMPKDYQGKWDPKANSFSMSVIPGSETALELERNKDKRQSSVLGKVDKVKMMNTNIDTAIDMLKTEEWATGIKGAFVRDYGGFLGAGSPAINLDATITSIKANIGFDKLQRMRDESQTGGALGQVAVMELIALQATLGSLDLRQSPELVIATLENVRDSYNDNMAIVLEQYGAEELKKYGIEYGGAGKSTVNDDPLGIR
jgi:hypothetical protein